MKRGRSKISAAKAKKRSAPSPNPQALRGVSNSPDLKPQDMMTGIFQPAQRATTFPTQPSKIDHLRIAPFAGPQFQPPVVPDLASGQNFQELISPSELSTTGTPESGSTANGNRQQSDYKFDQPLGDSSGLPDLSAMMFPSADPFAYPNQPIMEFDNLQNKDANMPGGTSAPPDVFLGNGNTGSGLYEDLQGQLFGPLPPYLMQNQATLDVSGQLNMDINGMDSLSPEDLSAYPGFSPDSGMNFDEVFSGNSDEWSNMLGEQGFKQ